MRILSIIALFLLLSSASYLAYAEATTPDQPATRIEVDEQQNVIRFFIDGQQKAVMDADGLHVRESIRYGETIIDYGPTGFDQHTTEAREGADAD